MSELADRFNYVYSCDLDISVQVKICTLEGERERPGYRELAGDPMLKFSGVYDEGCSDLYVTCQIYADGHVLALPVQTAYKAFTSRWNWNEWLTLPLKYSDLPRNAVLSLTIWDIYGPNKALPVGGTVTMLFGKSGTFRQGMHDLKIWPKVEADYNIPSTTPGKSKDVGDQMSRLAKLSKKHRDGHMPKVDWLDRLTFREIEMINEKQKRDSNFMYLMVEFPFIHFDGVEYAITYFEKDGDEPYSFNAQPEIVTVPDPDILTENLVENKHHKLARSLRSGPTDRDMKPDTKTRDHLNTIMSYPPTKTMSSEEEDMVWKFRFYLSNQKKALTKFLKCVNWNLAQEVKQTLDMLTRWSPMDVEDALELLSPMFKHPMVRKYAVTRLRQADDEDLLLYLLQLVQALKYEDYEQIKSGLDETVTQQRRDSLGTADSPGPLEKERSHSTGSHDSILDALGGPQKYEEEDKKLENEMDLATFLIYRASNNSVLANYFYWYLVVECGDQDMSKDQRVSDLYINVMKRFSQALMKGGKECRLRRSIIARQQMFMDKLIQLVKMVARESGNRKKKKVPTATLR